MTGTLTSEHDFTHIFHEQMADNNSQCAIVSHEIPMAEMFLAFSNFAGFYLSTICSFFVAPRVPSVRFGLRFIIARQFTMTSSWRGPENPDTFFDLLPTYLDLFQVELQLPVGVAHAHCS